MVEYEVWSHAAILEVSIGLSTGMPVIVLSTMIVSANHKESSMLDLTKLSGRITWLREKKKMRPSELCRAAKIKQSSLWSIENGETKELRSSTLFRLAAALDANPQWIRSGQGDPHTMDAPRDTKELVSLYESAPDHIKAAILAAARALSTP